MKHLRPLIFLLSMQLLVPSSGYSPIPDPSSVVQSRRAWLGRCVVASAAAAATTTGVLYKSGHSRAVAEEPIAGVGSSGGAAPADVYFGVGCFWHIQHEFVQAERDLLGRDDHQLTSRTGYAGGKAADGEGRVCYHNLQFVADYGRLGHGEAVGMTIPEDKIADFAEVYFSLYDPRTKDRVDPGDRGGEYRSVMGLPGGTQHPVYPKVATIAAQAGFKLKEGKGNDPDTLGKQIVYVYDTAKFPF
jgi:peptide methionine sulfoxide reductase MsrA